MRLIYRFEVLLDGEPQEVGLFHALDDMGITGDEATELTSLFDSLPCPELDEPVSFWFTEEGLRVFEAAINYFNGKISFHNWSLAGAFMPAPGEKGAWFKEKEVIYEDRFQLALPEEGVRDLISCDGIAFDEIANVDIFRMTSRNSTTLAFQREINTLPFDVPPSVLKELAERIEDTYSEENLCGQEFDALMYQLWQENPELVEGMGYMYWQN